jgi:hypothetical protein
VQHVMVLIDRIEGKLEQRKLMSHEAKGQSFQMLLSFWFGHGCLQP